MTLDYFYGQAGKLFSFYRIPKALFQEQRFQNLSTDAKTLYGILLDRMSLSVKNEWFDKQGRVFIIFTIEDVKRALCCADNKATKLLRELENFGLIERKRRGLGKPSLVYVKNFSSDLSNERVQNRENHESGSPKNACQDPPKSRCNKNKKSKTERNNTNPILSDELEKMKNRKLLEEYFSRSLEVELLLRLYPDDEDTIYQIVDLLVDTCDSKRKLIRIAGDDKPAEVVLSRLKKLNADHIRFVLDCLAANTSPIRNMKQYLLAALFNAPTTMHYNPFAYVHSEKDILKLVTTLMTNTKGEGSGGDPFWEKSERLLLTALIAYLHYEAPVEEQNFATLLEMLNTMQVLEDDEEYQNPVDLLFEELGKKKPNSFAVRQYKLYKLAAGKTAKSILISCGARLAPFDIQELRDLTMYDELALDTLGDKKTALFLIMSDTDSTFNFLISMVYTQLFNLLCDKADDQYGGKLPVHVRCLIDECANIGQIPNLEKLVATIRSREISACLVLQAKSQLKAIYKDNADTIIGNMDSQIFLGGSEPTTLKDLSEMLGKETIDAFNTSDTRGNSPSYGTTFQKMGHELLSRDELAVLDGGKCILQLRGVRPFLSDKYDLTQHPNYKLTSDYDPKNTFDIEKYLNRKEKIHPGDEFIVVDADSLPST